MLSVMTCHANTEKIAQTAVWSRAMLIFNVLHYFSITKLMTARYLLVYFSVCVS